MTNVFRPKLWTNGQHLRIMPIHKLALRVRSSFSHATQQRYAMRYMVTDRDILWPYKCHGICTTHSKIMPNRIDAPRSADLLYSVVRYSLRTQCHPTVSFSEASCPVYKLLNRISRQSITLWRGTMLYSFWISNKVGQWNHVHVSCIYVLLYQHPCLSLLGLSDAYVLKVIVPLDISPYTCLLLTSRACKCNLISHVGPLAIAPSSLKKALQRNMRNLSKCLAYW